MPKSWRDESRRTSPREQAEGREALGIRVVERMGRIRARSGRMSASVKLQCYPPHTPVEPNHPHEGCGPRLLQTQASGGPRLLRVLNWSRNGQSNGVCPRKKPATTSWSRLLFCRRCCCRAWIRVGVKVEERRNASEADGRRWYYYRIWKQQKDGSRIIKDEKACSCSRRASIQR